MDWWMRADLAEDGHLTLTRLDASGADLGLAGMGPVDHLMAAVAGCFVKSCHMVLEARGEARVAVSARVQGIKGEDRPARVARAVIAWAMPALSPDTAERVARDAKRICTVTNSMSAEFSLERLP